MDGTVIRREDREEKEGVNNLTAGVMRIANSKSNKKRIMNYVI